MWKWIIGIAAGLAATALGLAARAAARRDIAVNGKGIGAGVGFAPREGNVYVRDNVLHGPGGFRYNLTDEDLLWLARAVWGEAGTNQRGGAAVIWAMAQYHVLVLGRGDHRPKFASLTRLLRAYCQPINPIWATRGAGKCRERPERCMERHLVRRRQVTTASWNEIPSSVRSLVEAFADGTLPNPVPGTTDWAARDWQSRSQTPLIDIGGNYFGVGRDRRLYRG